MEQQNGKKSNEINLNNFEYGILDLLMCPEVNMLNLNIKKMVELTGLSKLTIYRWLEGKAKQNTHNDIIKKLQELRLNK